MDDMTLGAIKNFLNEPPWWIIALVSAAIVPVVKFLAWMIRYVASHMLRVARKVNSDLNANIERNVMRASADPYAFTALCDDHQMCRQYAVIWYVLSLVPLSRLPYGAGFGSLYSYIGLFALIAGTYWLFAAVIKRSMIQEVMDKRDN